MSLLLSLTPILTHVLQDLTHIFNSYIAGNILNVDVSMSQAFFFK